MNDRPQGGGPPRSPARPSVPRRHSEVVKRDLACPFHEIDYSCLFINVNIFQEYLFSIFSIAILKRRCRTLMLIQPGPLTRSTRTLQPHAQHSANSYKFPALKTSCNSVPVLQMKPPGLKPSGIAILTSPHTQPARERTLQPLDETRGAVWRDLGALTVRDFRGAPRLLGLDRAVRCRRRRRRRGSRGRFRCFDESRQRASLH